MPEANYECQQIGATLASFHSESDVAFSQQKAKIFSAYLEGLWIGLSIQSGKSLFFIQYNLFSINLSVLVYAFTQPLHHEQNMKQSRSLSA